MNALHGGAAAACAENKPLAGAYRFMHDIMDDVFAEAVIWMPSHVKKGGCDTTVRGDAFLLTEIDVEFNVMADRFAKAAVDEHRPPYRIRMAIAAHDALTKQNAMWIARATVIANQQPQDPDKDTQASRARAAEAVAVERRKKAQAAAEAAATKTETTRATPASTSVVARTPLNGGHTLEVTDVGWWCAACRTKSTPYDKLPPPRV